MAKLLVGINDLATTHPKLTAEWHPTKNGNLTPEQVTFGSNKKVWWQCSQGHEWQARISSRTNNGTGCPYCSGRFAIPGKTDLATTYPKLANEWHPTKNGELKPTKICYGAGKKVWWLCAKGHEWQARISNRTNNGTGCPYCSGRFAISGKTDLATANPKLAAEWHPTKNENLTPKQVTLGSNKKVWWLCAKGHEWQALISQRSYGAGCPYCSGLFAIPGKTDLATANPKLAAEWHPTKNTELALKQTTIGSHHNVWWQCSTCGHEWQARVFSRTKGSGCPVCSRITAIPGKTDLATTHPKLAKEWHPTKNDALTPNKVTYASNKRVWWQCSGCGYEWQAIIHNRTKGTGCPVCSRITAIPGKTDLATTHPKLTAEWHPTKNGNLTPEQVTFGSNKKVWWQCEHGHEWHATPNSRTGGRGCPYCANKKIISGYNDLSTINPQIATEWHPMKNGELKPTKICYGAGKKVWWRGKCGHEWQASISNRTNNGTGCPYCSGLFAIPGKTDLATTHPKLAKEWHPTKNGNLTPTQISHGSVKNVWWQCSKGHEWQAKINNRTKGKGCPVCKTRKKCI